VLGSALRFKFAVLTVAVPTDEREPDELLDDDPEDDGLEEGVGGS
jgi:hypothetical protein